MVHRNRRFFRWQRRTKRRRICEAKSCGCVACGSELLCIQQRREPWHRVLALGGAQAEGFYWTVSVAAFPGGRYAGYPAWQAGEDLRLYAGDRGGGEDHCLRRFHVVEKVFHRELAVNRAVIVIHLQ